jgi:hypothetical protein
MRSGFTTPILVAELMAAASCRDGIANRAVKEANPLHPRCGLRRLRDHKERFMILFPVGDVGYHYRSNRYFPTALFKRYCRRYIRDHK